MSGSDSNHQIELLIVFFLVTATSSTTVSSATLDYEPQALALLFIPYLPAPNPLFIASGALSAYLHSLSTSAYLPSSSLTLYPGPTAYQDNQDHDIDGCGGDSGAYYDNRGDTIQVGAYDGMKMRVGNGKWRDGVYDFKPGEYPSVYFECGRPPKGEDEAVVKEA